MPKRANVFAIHSWDDASACQRMQALLQASDPDLAHYTVSPERAIHGDDSTVQANIESRIQFATAVVVMNTPGLHKRRWSTFEMETAVRLGKRIVVVQPDQQFKLPVPRILDGHVYRFAGWRSDVVGRAIRGEYPADRRVFDIAEAADRRALVGTLSAGVAVSSFCVVLHTQAVWKTLAADLATAGVRLESNLIDGARVAGTALTWGLVAGLFTKLVTDDNQTALRIGLGAAALGAAVEVRRTYRIQVLGTERLRVLTIEPV